MLQIYKPVIFNFTGLLIEHILDCIYRTTTVNIEHRTEQ